MKCNKEKDCINFPNKCSICNAISDLVHNYPLYKKIEIPIKHIKLKEKLPEYDPIKDVFTIPSKVNTIVLNQIDHSIINAIIKYSKEHNFTDLIIIDEEFVISALTNEMKRREGLKQNDNL